MENYVRQLVSDIKSSHRKEIPKPMEKMTPAEQLLSQRKFISRDQDALFSKTCGLSREQFPPAEKLTPEQLSTILEEFILMLQSYYIDPELIGFMDVPEKFLYPAILDVLDEELTVLDEGWIAFQICVCNPHKCLLPKEYCTCWEFWEQEEAIQKREDEEKKKKKK